MQRLHHLRLGAFCLCASAALSALPSARAAEPLTWKFEVGAKSRYRLTQHMATTMHLGAGGNVEQVADNVIDMSWIVAEVQADGAAVLKQKIERMQMKIGVPGGGSIELDTKSSDEPQGFAAMLAALFREMTRGEFTLTVTPRGKITDVDIPVGVLDALQSAPGVQLMGEMATAEGLKKMISGISFELPETLEPGVQWTTTTEMDNPVLGKQTAKMTNRYLGPKEVEGVAYEAFAPTLEISFAGSADAQPKVAEQKSSGEVLFHRAAGRVESTRLDHELELTITVADHTIDQTLKQTVTLRWLPEDAE